MNARQAVVAQFRRPSGMLGHLAGFIMAHRPSNIERNRWTLDLVELKEADRVLEIGYGPGIALEQAAETLTQGLIVGIDHSETMLAQASKRNARSIRQGRMRLLSGSINDLPAFEQPFDKIYSANVVQFWDDPATEFRKLAQLLASGGLIATTYMPRHAHATSADTERMAEKIAQAKQQSGLVDVNVAIRRIDTMDATCVIARNS